MIEAASIIRKCNEADFPKVVVLFGQAYQFNPRLQELDYCDWQFKNTPFSKEDGYSILVSSYGKELVGFLGYLPIEFRFHNEIRLGCISYNWYSEGKNRSGIKLLSELMGRYENIFYLGCTTESEAIFNVFKMPMCFLSRWVGVIDENKVNALFSVRQQQINVVTHQNEGVCSCQRFDDDEEFFFDEWKSIKGYIRRTGKYLNWRYVDIPRHNYQILKSDKGQFAVYRMEQIKGHEEKVIRILEWNFYGKAAESALSLIMEQGQQQKAILIDFISTATQIGKYLETLGFFQPQNSKEGIPYLFRPIYYTRDILISIDLPPHRVVRDFNFNQWYITKGDSDMDRIKL